MYEHREALDVKSPDESLRRARVAYLIGAILGTGSLLLLPSFPWFQIGLVATCILLALRTSLLIGKNKERFEELGASRRYDFIAGHIPQQSDPSGQVVRHRKTPWGCDFSPPGVPYASQRTSIERFDRHGQTNSCQRHRKAWLEEDKLAELAKQAAEVKNAFPDHAQQFGPHLKQVGQHKRVAQGQAAWLKKYYAPRYEIVTDWYSRSILAPGIRDLYPFLAVSRASDDSGDASAQLISTITSWWNSLTQDAIVSVCPIMVGLDTIVQQAQGVWHIHPDADARCTDWLASNRKSGLQVLLDHAMQRRLAARGFGGIRWIELRHGAPVISQAAKDLVRNRFMQDLRKRLGGSAEHMGPEQLQQELVQELQNAYGVSSIEAWIKAEMLACREQLGAFFAAKDQATLHALILDTAAEALNPIKKQSWGSSAEHCAEHILQQVKKLKEVDFFEGIRLAMDPEQWYDSDDKRPSMQAIADLRRRLAGLGAERCSDGYQPSTIPDSSPSVSFPVPHDVYMGRGFFWDVKHTEAFNEQQGHNLSDLTKNPADHGDPRIFGVGMADKEEVFLEEGLLNQHTGIFGASGVGKTRYVEPIVVQAIRAGYPSIIIDPKGDQTLVDRVWEEARAHGRGNDLHFFSLASPKNPEVSTYNPLFTYQDPADLGSRVAAVMPATKDPFWTDVGTATAKTVCTLGHWVRRYLAFINRDSKGRQSAVTSAEVPNLLPALLWAKNNPGRSPSEAEQAIATIRGGMQTPGWQAAAEDQPIVQLLNHDMYRPVSWTPSMRMVEVYGISNTATFLAWSLKLCYFHLYTFTGEQLRPDYPELLDTQQVTALGGGSGSSMWAAYVAQRAHPLSLRCDSLAVGPDDDWSTTVRTYLDYFVSDDPNEHTELQEILDKLADALEGMRTLATEDPKTYQQHMSTLRSALSRFRGDRERIINAIDPDIRWNDVVAHNQIVYLYLGSLIDPVGSTGIAKAVVQELSSFIGEIYAYHPDRIKPFYLFCDEISSFINNAVIDLLARARGAGLRAVLIGQSIPDLEMALDSAARAQVVMANMSTMIQLRTQLDQDAHAFAERAGEAQIIERSRNVSMTPGYGDEGSAWIEGFTSNESRNFSEQTKQRIPSAALMNLPRGQAFIHTTGKVYMVAIGMLPDPDNNVLAEFGILASEQDDQADDHDEDTAQAEAEVLKVLATTRPSQATNAPAQAAPSTKPNCHPAAADTVSGTGDVVAADHLARQTGNLTQAPRSRPMATDITLDDDDSTF